MLQQNKYNCLLGLVSLVLCVNFSYAQIKPNSTTTVPSATGTVLTKPAAYNAGGTVIVNYVRTKEAVAPFTSTTAFELAGYEQVKQATQYLDGLGRPIQAVVKQASPLAKDMVSTNVYDEFGREAVKYLPYISTETNGSFQKDPFTPLEIFNSSLYTGDQVFYSQTQFEASPLNRPLKSFAPGNSWAGSIGGINERGVAISYEINDVNEVRIWNIDATSNLPITASTGGTYDAGQLYRTITTDEHGKKVVEYKDKEGKVVLKKVQISDATPTITSYSGWLSTYYIYDDFGLLRFVLPPRAVELLEPNSWDITASTVAGTLDELCFQYTYDYRNRMITKKVPGAGIVYMVYDKRDRLAYIQDANMRAKCQWLATLYDNLNRPISTGMVSFTTGSSYCTNRDALQTYIDEEFDNPTSTTITSNRTAPADLFVDQRETGKTSYYATNSITINNDFTSETNAEFETFLEPHTESTNTTTLTYNPLPTGGVYTALTYTFYDNYNFLAGSKSFNASYFNTTNFNTTTATGYYPDPLPTVASTAIKGMVTGTKVRILENPNDLTQGGWLETASYYDDKGRVIQTQTDNHTQGIDISNVQYDFSGKALATYTIHNNPAAPQTIIVKNVSTYDIGGRLLNVKKTINNDASTTRTVLQNEYNEVGQLVSKKIGQKSLTDLDPLETLDYSYNIRGWLKGINNGFVSGSVTDRWFGMNLSYDYGFDETVSGTTASNGMFNGNISGIQWKSKGDNENRAYGFRYDPANRLLMADFNQKFASGWDKTNSALGINFSVWMGTDGTNNGTAYDANGNIKQMQQWGLKLNTSPQIDNLVYRYYDNSNKLKAVIDDGYNDPLTKLGDFRASQSYLTTLGGSKLNNATVYTDYAYDLNGNLKKDLNKDIDDAITDGITYNHLNLPYQVKVRNKGTITYIYDATGNKLKKKVVEGSNITTTDYVNGYVYETKSTTTNNPELQFFGQEEGRIRKGENGNFLFDYFIKDHLGNVRMTLTDEEKMQAYPPASMETANRANEELYYSNIALTESNLPAGYPIDSYTNPNNKVAKLSYNGNKIGPGIVLKVMSGDKVNIRASAWYNTYSTPINTPTGNALPSLLSALSSGIIAATGGVKATLSQLQATGVLDPGITNFINSQSYTSTTRPKAYLNWMLLDEQFQFVLGSSGAEPVGDDNEFKIWVKNNLPISKNGYLYVYTSNESAIDVFFDNLQVTHTKSPLVEETHYYPFGLTMSGISSKAVNTLQNKYKYNGKELNSNEFSDGSGLEWSDYGARMYDDQIGRFTTQDPHSYRYATSTPYNYGFNNPISNIDPDGRDGKVSGTGSEEDPYTITANYYYYGLNEKQVKGLSSAIAGYNNGGKAVKVKVGGKDVYVKYNLSAKEAANKDEATSSARGDTYEATDGSTKRFGNILNVDYKAEGSGDAYANSNNFEISLNGALIDKHTSTGQDIDGQNVVLDYNKLITAAFEHEIGHNLTAMHGDPGGLMEKVGTIVDRSGFNGVKILTNYPTVTKVAIGAMLQRIDRPYGTDYAKDADYIQATQDGQAPSPKGFGTTGRIYTEKKH